MVATIRHCERCKQIKVTSLVTFKSNVSFLFRRIERKLSGYLCLSCMTKEFLAFELPTLFGTWWGIIGAILGPFFIVHNLSEYIDGSLNIIRAKRLSKMDGQTVRPNIPETQTTIKSIPDYVAVGKSLGEIFVKPDVWRDINRLHGHQVPESVVNYEAAIARVAIIRETVIQRKIDVIATQMLSGIDQYIFDAFNHECDKEILDYYKQIQLDVVASVAIRAYEHKVFPLTELAVVFARRLSIVGLPATEIAALFEEVKAEAELLLRFSTGVQR